MPMATPLPLSDATRRLVELAFAAADWPLVSALLQERCGAGLPQLPPGDGNDHERVRFATIKLSGGDVKELARHVERANVDWRDVLVAAGFGCSTSAHRDWLDTLPPH